MNAIRPLATLTILLVLGIVLWHRISTPSLEPPAEDLEELAMDVESAPAFDGSTSEATTGSANSSAPAFKPEAAPEASANNLPPIKPLDTSAMGELPPLPELPSTGESDPSVNLPLPENVPTAKYPGEGDEASDPPVGVATGNVPSLGTQVGDSAQAATGETPPAADQQPEASAMPDFPPITPESESPPSSVADEFDPPESEFVKAKKAVDEVLAAGDFRQALMLLTSWYGDRTLTMTEQAELETLLSQLAGTVIYSTDYQIEPPHIAVEGETLETIAARYQVPWQLLAKINGIATPDGVKPGQTLKVLKGPFSGVIDLKRQEMALMVSGMYAGRFSVKTEGMATDEGEWKVAQKQLPAGTPKHLVLTGNITSPDSVSSIVLGTMSVESRAAMAGAIRVSPPDQDDLFDIFSVGSRVIIRR